MVAHAKPKLIPIEPVIQRNGHDCGPAACRAVLHHFGVPLVGIDRTLRPCRVNGTPPDRIAWLMAASGLGVAMRPNMTGDHLRECTELGWPVLCPVQVDGDGHWVVTRGLGRDRVYLMDPADGLTDEPLDGFLDRWRDTAADGTRLTRFGIVVFRHGGMA